MSDGFDTGVLPQRPRRPSATLFLISTAIVVASLVALMTTIFVERHNAAMLRVDATRTGERRLLLSDTLAAIALSETAERSVRETRDPVAFSRYAAAREQLSRGLSALLDAVHRNDETIVGLLRLRELVEARFAATDMTLRAASTGFGRGAAISPEEIRLSRVIDGVGDWLCAIEGGRLTSDNNRVDTKVAEIGSLFWVISVVTILATIIGFWLWWRASSKHFELEIRAYDALSRLRAVFEGTSDAIVVIRPSGRIEEANSAAASLLGYDIGALEGRNIADIIDIDDIPQERRLGFLNGKIAMPVRLDRIARDHDGNTIPVDVALGLVPFASGVRIVASLRDFSERRAAERMKDDFISTISHELRTPLTSVVGALGLLREGAAGVLPDAATRLVDIAENNSRRLIRLINDILDIDRLGSGRVRLDVKPVDLRTIAVLARDGAEGLATPRAVRIALAPPENAIVVAGDAERLLQVIGNLLSNAVRFSPTEGTVALTLEVRGREALVRVDDEGPGVPAEFRDSLFGRFTQSRAGAAIPGGTGLGLAISREIVRAHGGEIWYADRPGGGSRFCFSLPIAQEAETGHVRRLLLCEDDVRIAALMRELIEGEDYIVDRCGSIAEARAMARSGRYDALLLDLSLPDASGLEAVAAIRAQSETRDLPLIVISGSASIHRHDPAAQRFGVIDWIDKPVNHERLLRTLSEAITAADDNRPVLLHVENDADVREVVALAIADRGRILQAGTLASARAALAACAPAAVILDLDLPDGSGLDLMPLLTDGPGGAIPTVVYSAGVDLPPIGGPIEAVLVKSARSPLVLSETIGAILKRKT
jgi:PAS domain S-box-containing protein